jgi:iron complex outermembrane receptor protein
LRTLLFAALLAQDTVPPTPRPLRPDTVGDLVVTATRTTRRVEVEPTRIETLSRDEIEEKLLMTPGDISMLLNESSGLRVQNTAPSLGGANLRIQGLRGRYTRLLQDGLPLAGTQPGSLGMLQIPPMDLGRVEVVKGVASPFYGGSALGGVVNLVSRRPEGREVLVNQSTLDATDAVLWTGGRHGTRWQSSLLAGFHRQRRKDRDRDGWTDVPGYRRLVARPRLYWNDPESGRSFFLTTGITLEGRDGGTLPGHLAPDGRPFPEALDSYQADLGAVGRWVPRFGVLTARLATSTRRHDQRRGPAHERDHHFSLFAELTATIPSGPGTLLLGSTFELDRYRNRPAAQHNYTFATPAVMAQYDWEPSDRFGATGTARLDAHSRYGAMPSARVAARIEVGQKWALRLSAGSGFFGPTPFVEETEAIGLTRFAPIEGLRAERMTGGSVDVGGLLGPVELNLSLFGSELRWPTVLREGGEPGSVRLVNATHPTRTAGLEVLGRARLGPVTATVSYTWLDASELDRAGQGRRTVPLNPRHALGTVVVWEQEHTGRIGLEAFLTGPQRLEDNPYRDVTPSYVVIGLLAERRLGRVRVFLNLENLTDQRQTRYDPLPRPVPLPDGRWIVDLWAPAEGRVANLGVRLDLKSDQ